MWSLSHDVLHNFLGIPLIIIFQLLLDIISLRQHLLLRLLQALNLVLFFLNDKSFECIEDGL